MSPEPNVFDLFPSSSGPRFDPTGAVSLPAQRLGSEIKPLDREPASIVDLRRKNQQLNGQVNELQDQLTALQRQLEEERQISQNLQLAQLVAGESDRAVDTERVARRLARALYQLVPCEIGLVWVYQAAEQRFKLLATTGAMAYLISSSLQPGDVLPGIFERLSDSSVKQAGEIKINGQMFPRCLIAPVASPGELRGLMILATLKEQPFEDRAVRAVETAAAQLLTAWQMARPYEVLSDFVQSITSFSAVQETGSLMERIADTARTQLHARFTVVAVQMQQEWKLRYSGSAPQVLESLQGSAWSFLEEAVRSPYTFRIRNVRTDERASIIEVDGEDYSTLLCSPIRIYGASSGILLAFGKKTGDAFSDFDVFLAEKLAAHAAINLESCYLNQELSESLKTTRLLYDLSQQMSSADQLNEAAWLIANTAYRLYQAQECGLMLYGLDGLKKVAEICLPDGNETPPAEELIQQVMDTHQMILLSDPEGATRLIVPVKSKRLCYGALWMLVTDRADSPQRAPEEIQAVVSQAAIAVERMFLLQETRSQARELERALNELEGSYDQTIQALTRALDARDRETENHSVRVTNMSVWLGEKMGLPAEEIKALRRGAMLHDLGKLGIRDHVLLKPGQLNEEEWAQMRRHPDKGVEIIQEIAPLGDAVPVIIGHQERWDGSGYPRHLKGEEIPVLARIFAVIDVYDALTSDRPYRKKSPKEEVLQYLESMAGIHFDPAIVATFTHLMRTDPPQGEE